MNENEEFDYAALAEEAHRVRLELEAFYGNRGIPIAD